jgi:hypothetical protein
MMELYTFPSAVGEWMLREPAAASEGCLSSFAASKVFLVSLRLLG